MGSVGRSAERSDCAEASPSSAAASPAEDRIFDEMWEQERLKKVQRARDDMERTHRMNLQLRCGAAVGALACDARHERQSGFQDRGLSESIVYQKENFGDPGGKDNVNEAVWFHWLAPPPLPPAAQAPPLWISKGRAQG